MSDTHRLLPCKFIRSTAKAVLLEIDDPRDKSVKLEKWFPVSQIELYGGKDFGACTEVSIPAWLYRKIEEGED